MKKTTKTKKTPAPATKPAAAPKIAKPAAPAVVTKPKVSRVTIVAKIDVGFGNTLYVRGDGAGLAWDKGTLLTCESSDTWSIVLDRVSKPIAFKFVLNDIEWSAGEDYMAMPGDTVTVGPVF